MTGHVSSAERISEPDDLSSTMRLTGHVGAALLLFAPLGFVASVAGAADLATFGPLGAIGLAKLPDVDRALPWIEHRGLTHTVWFALLLGGALGVGGFLFESGGGVGFATGVGLFVGATGFLTVCSHLAADALTPMGVRPFAPVRSRSFAYGLARSTNSVANYALLAIGATVLGTAYWLASLLVG